MGASLVKNLPFLLFFCISIIHVILSFFFCKDLVHLSILLSVLDDVIFKQLSNFDQNCPIITGCERLINDLGFQLVDYRK